MIQVQDLCQINLTGAGVVSVGLCLQKKKTNAVANDYVLHPTRHLEMDA